MSFVEEHDKVKNLMRLSLYNLQEGSLFLSSLNCETSYFCESPQLWHNRCTKPNLVETFLDERKFPVRFTDTDTMVSEKILNHEEFNLTIR